MEWQTFGHKSVKNILNKHLESGKFPHAYLFFGPEGVGKKTLCLEFSKKVLNTEKLENHPDFQILDIGNGEITVESIVEFIRTLSFKPFVASKKIAVINNAENLNTQSSNALLKTLEEPPSSSLIILIAGSGKLLPTIVSRCQNFNFNIFSDSQLREFSQSRSFEAPKEVLDLSFGQISKMKQLAEDKDLLASRQEIARAYSKLSQKSLAEKILSVSQYAEMENGELRENLLLWLNLQAKELADRPQHYGKLQALSYSLQALAKNQNKKLVLQNLFLKI